MTAGPGPGHRITGPDSPGCPGNLTRPASPGAEASRHPARDLTRPPRPIPAIPVQWLRLSTP